MELARFLLQSDSLPSFQLRRVFVAAIKGGDPRGGEAVDDNEAEGEAVT